jgi:1-acyl-sn-glycerol-3-phosphate acyltransferase
MIIENIYYFHSSSEANPAPHMIFSWFQAGRSVLVFGILYLFTFIMVIIALVFILFFLKRTIPYLIDFWANSIFFIMGKKIYITGRENIKKGDNYILVANHSSLFDIVAIVSFFPTITWFGHERLLKIPLFRRILKLTDYIPVREKSIKNTREMLEHLVQKSHEHSVAIFPEGTRSLDGKINVFYKGFIYLLRASKIDVLPVTLNGFYKLKPKTRPHIDFRAGLGIIIHKPIEYKKLSRKEDQEIMHEVREVILSGYSP